ncbi:hypothetical protein LDENG_00299250 [Lucifuga dentata]|nr:hypothetical protein LDENG_00299250 [Lucifuga dentata]
MKKENYHSILQRHAIPFGLQIIGQNFILQQDNDPNHSSKYAKITSIQKRSKRF